MIKYIVLVLALLFISSCSKESELPAGLRAGGFKLADPSLQEIVLKQMTELSIPFKVDEKGIAIYMEKDVAEVRGLMRKALYGEELSDKVIESELFMDSEHRQLLISKFDERGIPYKLDSSYGFDEHITWSQLYGPKVDLIIQEVGFESYEQVINKLKAEDKPLL